MQSLFTENLPFSTPVEMVSVTPSGTSIVVVAENRILIQTVSDGGYDLEMNGSPTACVWLNDFTVCMGFESGITLCVSSTGRILNIT